MRVEQLVRYPVKSLGGEPVDEVEVTALGLTGDRQWGVLDVDSGLTLTGRRTPELLFASARLAGSDVIISLPDGTELGPGDDTDGALSAWLGRDARLVRAGADAAPGRFENPLRVDEHEEADWVEWTGPDRTLHDSGRTMVSLASRAAIGAWETRRFRFNVVLDGRDEDALVDSSVEVGGCRLEVVKRISRCVMVTRPLPGGVGRDLSVLQSINARRDGCLGVGAIVARPGRVAVGDRLVVAV